MLKVNNEYMGLASIFCDADVDREDLDEVAQRERWTYWLPYSLKVTDVKMGSLLQMKRFVDQHLKDCGFTLIEAKHYAFI